MSSVRNTDPFFLQDDNEDFDECHGSCERCGCDLHEEDVDYYCDQCEYWIENVTPEER